MKQFPLGKKNKLCSRIAIDALFSRDLAPAASSSIAYPLRAVWRINPARKADIDTPKFFISIPKKRIRSAVGRVLMRRRVREAYRLLRPELFGSMQLPVDIAFLYIADTQVDSSRIHTAMERLMKNISRTTIPEKEE